MSILCRFQIACLLAVVSGAEDLAEHLQRWVADPAACRASGTRARQWVLERYVTSVIAGRTREFWSAVAEGRGTN